MNIFCCLGRITDNKISVPIVRSPYVLITAVKQRNTIKLIDKDNNTTADFFFFKCLLMVTLFVRYFAASVGVISVAARIGVRKLQRIASAVVNALNITTIG